jgi:hypothetical protein
MAKYKVLMIGNIWPDTKIEKEIVNEADAELIVNDGKDEKIYSKLISEADAIIPGSFQVTDKVLSLSAMTISM